MSNPKKLKTPPKPSLAKRVAEIEELPWNATAAETIQAVNKIILALQGEG